MQRLTKSEARTLALAIQSYRSVLAEETNPVARLEIERMIAHREATLSRGAW